MVLTGGLLQQFFKLSLKTVNFITSPTLLKFVLVLVFMNKDALAAALRDMSAAKYVTYKITWYYEKFHIEILNESQTLLTESLYFPV